MANSERDILAKIGDTLVEINEDYSSLQQKGHDDQNLINLYLLTAKTKQLTAYFEVLEKIENAKSSASAIQSISATTSGVNDGTSEEANNEIAEQVENVPQEYQHADSEPKMQEVEDSEGFVPEVEQEWSEDEYKEDDRFISSETVDHGEETAEDMEQEEDEPADQDAEQVTDEETEVPEEEEPEAAAEGEDDREEEPETAAETEDPEVSNEEEPDADSTNGENDPKEGESVSTEEHKGQHDNDQLPTRQEQPTVTQVVEETREVAIEQEAKPEPEEKPSRPLTLNEIIQQQKKGGLTNANQFHTTTQSERVLDLKTAVSLNDKLLFIKDLFNGYSLAYSEAIELLNRFDNFAEADVFLQTNYAIKNNWGSKPQTVEKLYAILRKKFI